MSLIPRADGSYEMFGDPGEPSTGSPRVSITDEEGKILALYADGERVLEIGTGLGVSTRHLASTAISVHTVDIDKWVQENVWPTLPAHCTTSDEVPLDREFDMVFIDGAHNPTQVRADVGVALTVCPRGTIIAHDANYVWQEIAKATPEGEWKLMNTTHGLAILERDA